MPAFLWVWLMDNRSTHPLCGYTDLNWCLTVPELQCWWCLQHLL